MPLGTDVLKQKFGPKQSAGPLVPETTEHGESLAVNANIEVDVPPAVEDWKMKHLPDPQGHYNTVMELFNLHEIPVVVPNVRDAEGILIHPAEYSEKLTAGLPVTVEVIMRL